MGRQGPLASLALGRSPFEAPEFDEHDNFVLGPHAHDFENADHYIQQFDSRGHPQNRASKAVTRAMEHAQNAVLETVGVVIKKEEAKSDEQKRNELSKISEIIAEADWGSRFDQFSGLIAQAAAWWLHSLRLRYQTFSFYSEIPLSHAIIAEIRILGSQQFFFSGLLPSIASRSVPGVRNVFITWLNGEFDLKEGPGARLRHIKRAFTWDKFVFRLIRMPIQAFGHLKSLNLITHTSHMGISSFVPFTSSSPIQLVHWPKVVSWSSVLHFGTGVCCHPLILLLIHEYLTEHLQASIYRIIILTLVERPNRPDNLCMMASDFCEEKEVPNIDIGHSHPIERLAEKRSSDFWTEVRHEIRASLPHPWFRYWDFKYRTFGMSFADRLEKAGSRCRDLYFAYPRSRNESVQRTRRESVRAAFEEFGIPENLPGNTVDDFVMRYLVVPYSSTATPEPVDLSEIGDPQQALELQMRSSAHEAPELRTRRNPEDQNDLDGQQLRHLNQPRSPQRTAEQIWESAWPGGFQQPIREVDAGGWTGRDHLRSSSESGPPPTPPSTTPMNDDLEVPVPFISAVSLPSNDSSQENRGDGTVRFTADSPVFPAPTHDPPAARILSMFDASTDVLQETSHLESNRSNPPSPSTATPPPITMMNREAYQPPTPPRRHGTSDSSMDSHEMASRRRNATTRASTTNWDFTHDKKSPAGPRHRVTALSMFPAKMLADFTSKIIASAILLPFSSLYLRSLVFGFLGSPAGRSGAAEAALGIRRDVIGLGAWFGGGNWGWMGRVRYAGVMALALGLNGVISSLIWGVESGLATYIGEKKGWGRLGRRDSR